MVAGEGGQDSKHDGLVDGRVAIWHLSAMDDQDAELRKIIGDVHAGFDLNRGPLLRAVLFELGAGRRPLLFLAAHHLVVDGVSWRILLEDLTIAYQQAVRGETVQLGPKTTAFAEWAWRLRELAAARGFDD